jgi:hypothetical protein
MKTEGYSFERYIEFPLTRHYPLFPQSKNSAASAFLRRKQKVVKGEIDPNQFDVPLEPQRNFDCVTKE